MLNEARCLFQEGINRGMVSTYSEDGLPKYVWAVDSDDVYLKRNVRETAEIIMATNLETMKKL